MVTVRYVGGEVDQWVFEPDDNLHGRYDFNVFNDFTQEMQEADADFLIGAYPGQFVDVGAKGASK